MAAFDPDCKISDTLEEDDEDTLENYRKRSEHGWKPKVDLPNIPDLCMMRHPAVRSE